MELYFDFIKCDKCGTIWVHIYEEEKRRWTKDCIVVYFYETCLKCEALGYKDTMKHYKTTLESWEDFIRQLCN